MKPAIYATFIKFLKEELALSNDSIEILQRSVEEHPAPVPDDPLAVWSDYFRGTRSHL